MTRRQYAGGAAAALITSAISSSGGGTVTIDNIAGWPDGSVGKFHVVVDPGLSSEEKILVDLRAGNSLNFSSSGRGADGTVSTSHTTGASIWICYTAIDADEANAHVNAVGGAHPATAITFAPTATIVASNVQGALVELDADLDVRMDAHEAAMDGRVDGVDARLNAIESPSWVTQTRMADASVGTTELVDASVTFAKLAANTVSRWTGSATIPTGTAPLILWSSEQEDDLNLGTTPSTPFTVITMPVGSDGWWGVDLTLTADISLGDGFYQLTKNNVFGYRLPHLMLTGGGGIGCTWNLYLVAGDTLDIRIQNSNGINTANLTAMTLKMCRIGKVA